MPAADIRVCPFLSLHHLFPHDPVYLFKRDVGRLLFPDGKGVPAYKLPYRVRDEYPPVVYCPAVFCPSCLYLPDTHALFE